MVTIRVLGLFVLAEALILLVVVHSISLARPTLVTLDAKVVLRFTGQGAVARPRLDDALSQSNGGRNLMILHLLHGDVLISLDILFNGDFLRHQRERHEQQQQKDTSHHEVKFGWVKI